MNRGFRQTYGNYRRDTDSYSMRSGDRTHQENRPRNRRFDPSRAAFHERRENYTDAPPAYETIVPRNNQEHGGNHTDAPPAYETDAPPAYETIYQENRPGNRRFDPGRAAFHEWNNQEQVVGGNANLGMQGDRTQRPLQGQNEVGDNLGQIAQTTKRFVAKYAAADALMFHNWLYRSNGELNPTRAYILADLEQQYNKQDSKVKSSESHFLTFFLEGLKEGKAKSKKKVKVDAHDTKSSVYEASYQAGLEAGYQASLEESENRAKEEMDVVDTKNAYLESKIKKKVDRVDFNTSELPYDEGGELGSISV